MELYRREDIKEDMEIMDITGKKSLPAKKVFALSIKYLKDDLLEMSNKQIGFNPENISWVLTVPAIWNDAAKQLMRLAAEEAGIPSNHLSIALEPEAASLYCRCLTVEKNEDSIGKLKSGSKYLIVDAGGGTIDMTVHEVMRDDTLKELHKASGGDWGGVMVNTEFERFMDEICGCTIMNELKKKAMDDYAALLREFEIKKRDFTLWTLDSAKKITFNLPFNMTTFVKNLTKRALEKQIETKGYNKAIEIDKLRLRVNAAFLTEKLFIGPVTKITDHINTLLQDPKLRDCSTILMVGGFSESHILQDRIKKAFHKKKIIIPPESDLAVLKGAVIFGHDPNVISERICKFTYGTRKTHIKSSKCNHPPGRLYTDIDGNIRCDNIFRCHVKEGTAVKLGDKQPEILSTPVNDDQSTMTYEIFASKSPNVYFTTDKNCIKIGSLDIPITDKSLGKARQYGASFMFGGTEIKVSVEDKTTKETKTLRVDFLG